MAQVGQKIDGIRWVTNKSAEVEYWIFNATSEEEARDALDNAAPPTFHGLVRSDELTIRATRQELTWEGIVNYGALGISGVSPPPTGGFELAFDITGGNHRQVFSFGQTGYAPGAELVPDCEGGINVDDQGNPQGVDVLIPISQRTIRYFAPFGSVSEEYVKTLEDLVGTTNNATYRGRERGEVLFMGASGKQRREGPDADFEISFQFGISKNLQDLAVGGITIPLVRGWQYLWVMWEKTDDPNAIQIVPRARAAYVEQVYQEANFNLLGLPS